MLTRLAWEDLDEAADHVRGPAGAPVILVYGDYECPYTRLAYRQIQHVERHLDGRVRFAYRHFPLTEIHPHALAASLAAEAAHQQDRFWDMHELLFHRQKALADSDLRSYAAELDLDLDRFDTDRISQTAHDRVGRDRDTGRRSGLVHGTPTLFINGAVYRGDYAAERLLDRLAR